MPHGNKCRPANKRNRDPSAVANYKPCCTNANAVRKDSNVKSPAGASNSNPCIASGGY
jgi:hypothetical protein